MFFKKKPVTIDAIRLSRPIKIQTLEGEMLGNAGDWLITGVKGEQYPCKDDVFRETYEPVDAAACAYLDQVSRADWCSHVDSDGG